MANVKVTALTSLTAADSAATDVLPIVDVSADATKKLAISDLHRSVPDGTLSAPGIAFQSDLNSGLYRSGTDAIALVTNGAARILVDATGNVTIPNDLTVQGATTFITGQTVLIEDKNIELGVVSTPTDVTADGGGITLKGATDKTIKWIDSTNAWTFNNMISVQTSVSSTAYAEIRTNADALGLNANLTAGSSASDSVALNFKTSNSGSETTKMRIDPDGKVGVGTEEPGEILHVNGTASAIKIDSNGDAALRFATSGTNKFSIYHTSGGTLNFFDNTNSQNRLSITSTGNAEFSGNVGVSTSSFPANGKNLKISDGTISRLVLEKTGTGARVFEVGVGNSFLNVYDATADEERIKIDSSGNVGINTSPSSKLHVKGSADCYLTLEAGSTDGNDAILFKNSAGVQKGAILYDTDDNYLVFNVNGGERLKITSTGNAEFNGQVKADSTSGAFQASRSDGAANHVFRGGTSTSNYTSVITANGQLTLSGASGAFQATRSDGAANHVFRAGTSTSNYTTVITAAGTATFGPTSGSYVQLAQNSGVTINDGIIDLYAASDNVSSKLFKVQSDVGGTKVEKAFITAAGAAEFDNTVRSNEGYTVYPPSDSNYSFATRNAANNTWSAFITAAGSATFASGNIVNTSSGVIQVLRGADNPIFEGYLGAGILPANKKVTINSSGSASFAGDLTEITADGGIISGIIELQGDRNSSTSAISVRPTTAGSSPTVTIGTDGSASFAGGLTNITSTYGLLVANGTNSYAGLYNTDSTLKMGNLESGIYRITLDSTDGSAQFLGTVRSRNSSSSSAVVFAANFNGSDKAYILANGSMKMGGDLSGNGNILLDAGNGQGRFAGQIYGQSLIQSTSNSGFVSISIDGGAQNAFRALDNAGNTNVFIAADGSARFVGDAKAGEPGVRIEDSGLLSVCRNSATAAVFAGYPTGSTTATSVIGADGTVTFAGNSNLQGNVNVGTNTSAAYLQFPALTGWGPRIAQGDASINDFAVFTDNTEHLTVKSSGNVLVGTTSSQTIGNSQAQLEVSTDSSSGYALSLSRSVADIYGPQINFRSTRGTAASPVIVNDDDQLGSIAFYGYDGTDSNHQHASIAAFVDGTPGSNDCPGRIVFSTTADGEPSPTPRMSIDSSGTVGIGIDNASAGDGKLSVLATGAGAGTSNTRLFMTGYEATSGNAAGLWFGARTDQNTGVIGSRTASGSIAFETYSGGWGERMRILNDGHVLFGGTSTADNDHANFDANGSLTIRRTNATDVAVAIVEDGTVSSRIYADGAIVNYNVGAFAFTAFDNESGTSGAYAALGSLNLSGDKQAQITAGSSASDDVSLVFRTSNGGTETERIKISGVGQIDTFTSSGFIGIRNGATSTSNAAIAYLKGATDNTNGTVCFVVRQDGDVENTNNSYGSLSDVKLKENIVDASSQWSDIKSLQVRNYNFKESTGFDTHTQIGVIAQEVETVSPGLVSESPDTDGEGNDLGTKTKSVNYSVLYMKAVKALQEAMERIESLETRIAALES